MSYSNVKKTVDEFWLLEKAEEVFSEKGDVFGIKTFLSVLSVGALLSFNEMYFENHYLPLIENEAFASIVGFLNVILFIIGLFLVIGSISLFLDDSDTKIVLNIEKHIESKFKNAFEYNLLFSLLGKKLTDFNNFGEIKESIIEKKEELSAIMLKKDFILSLKDEIESDYVKNKNYASFLSKLLEIYNEEKVKERSVFNKLNKQLKNADVEELKPSGDELDLKIIELDK